MPLQLSGNGRSDRSTWLIHGLSTEAAAGFRSRREQCREPAPVTFQYAAFETYKAARIHRVFGGAAAWPLRLRAQQRESCQPLGSWARARFKLEPLDRRFCATAARARLDRGAHGRDRVSLGEGQSERFAEFAAEFVRLKVDVISQ